MVVVAQIMGCELILHDVITGTDPKENIVSDPLLLHDVITGTDHKENTGRVHCCVA
jgi:hypothetical protein